MSNLVDILFKEAYFGNAILDQYEKDFKQIQISVPISGSKESVEIKGVIGTTTAEHEMISFDVKSTGKIPVKALSNFRKSFESAMDKFDQEYKKLQVDFTKAMKDGADKAF